MYWNKETECNGWGTIWRTNCPIQLPYITEQYLPIQLPNTAEEYCPIQLPNSSPNRGEDYQICYGGSPCAVCWQKLLDSRETKWNGVGTKSANEPSDAIPVHQSDTIPVRYQYRFGFVPIQVSLVLELNNIRRVSTRSHQFPVIVSTVVFGIRP